MARKKTVRKKAASRSETSRPGGTTGTAPNRVAVRMYRQGLGDCFLLTLPGDDGQPYFMLIDCGVLLGTLRQNDLMKEIVQDVRDTTDGHLNLLVVTHEHWDHVSGFLQAREVFDEIQIDDVWLAWTEDPDNETANELRRQREQRLRALVRAIAQLRALESARGVRSGESSDHDDGRPVSDDIQAILDFFGPLTTATTEDAAEAGELQLSGPLGARPGTSDALAVVHELLGDKTPHYLHPSDPPVTIPDVSGFRFYVLGPPDNRLLRRSNPTKRGREVYELAFAFGPEAAFEAALADMTRETLGLSEDEKTWVACNRPFEGGDATISVEEARENPFFRECYFGSKDTGDENPAWRQIEEDWLHVAEQLALKLDAHTNNTSLVLAIESVASGKVLLFPGDAQVGNWLSWHDLPGWDVPERENKVTADDLLARTVLYKVGHHGSHNATLRDLGLERMHHPDLVAMIPVDRDLAARQGRHGWNMPFRPLLERLVQKSRGRVLRADTGLDEMEKPDDVPDRQWRTFLESVTETDLYFEFGMDLD